MSGRNDSRQWCALTEHATALKDVHMRDMFAQDHARFEHFHVRQRDLLLDFSKNRITRETMDLLLALGRACGIEAGREAMFCGEHVNTSEGRAAAHVALRQQDDTPFMIDGHDVMPDVAKVRDRMRVFSERVRSGEWKGATGKAITDVVNIGIGGSDLGPSMVVEALSPYRRPDLRVHFVSNVDGSQLAETLKLLTPETTLFIVASKTFTTLETIANATTARGWLVEKLGAPAIPKHFAALSTNSEQVAAFGIDLDVMFEFWDWVGGRFSLWSAIGLSICIGLGFDRFMELQAGARSMDQHFRTQPLAQNMPVILALVGVWNRNFLGAHSIAILPYDHYLRLFPAFLQQLDMESNGKATCRDGNPVAWATGPVVFGAAGTNGQHAFYQLIHQGTELIPADFLLAANSQTPLDVHHDLLVANALAQAEAFMMGRTLAESMAELVAEGQNPEQVAALAPHRVFPGNRPTNMLLYPQLDPFTLGQIIALYEHKIFIQGLIWDVDSFDQWGVELGKTLAKAIVPELSSPGPVLGGRKGGHDCSTSALINAIKDLRQG